MRKNVFAVALGLFLLTILGPEALAQRERPSTHRLGIPEDVYDAADAMDNLARQAEEWGTMQMSAPLLIEPGSNYFTFNVVRGSSNYFNEAKSNIQASSASLDQVSQSLNIALQVQTDPALAAASTAVAQQITSQAQTAATTQTLLQQVNQIQFTQALNAALAQTNPAAQQSMLATLQSNLMAAIPTNSVATNLLLAGSAKSGSSSGSNSNNASASKTGGNSSSNSVQPAAYLALLAGLNSPNPSLNNRTALNIAAGDQISEGIYRLLSDPQKAADFANRKILFGVVTVSVNPGYRTRKGYAADLGIMPKFELDSARLEVVKRTLRDTSIPLNIRAALLVSRNLAVTNLPEYYTSKPAPTNAASVKPEPTNAVPTNVVPTNVVPTNVVPTNVVPTNVVPTNVVPTNVVPTNVVPTNVVPTNVVPTNVVPTNVVPTNVVPTNVVPTNVVPTNVVPTNVVPTNVVPTNVVPTNVVPTNAVSTKTQPDETESPDLVIIDQIAAYYKSQPDQQSRQLTKWLLNTNMPSDFTNMDLSTPLAMAVSPLSDMEVMDEASSLQSQTQFGLSLAAMMRAAGLGAQASVVEQYVHNHEQDSRSRTALTTISTYSSGGGLFGWQVRPAFRAQGDAGSSSGNGPADVLDSQTFPALVTIGYNDEDLRPRFKIKYKMGCIQAEQVESVDLLEPELAFTSFNRWLPLKNGWWQKRYSERDRLEASARLKRARDHISSLSDKGFPGASALASNRLRALQYQVFGGVVAQTLAPSNIVPNIVPLLPPPPKTNNTSKPLVIPEITQVFPSNVVLTAAGGKTNQEFALVGNNLNLLTLKPEVLTGPADLSGITAKFTDNVIVLTANITNSGPIIFYFPFDLTNNPSVKIVTPNITVFPSKPADDSAPKVVLKTSLTQAPAAGSPTEYTVEIAPKASLDQLQAAMAIAENEINKAKPQIILTNCPAPCAKTNQNH